jgi:hypothetical protein
LQKLNVLLLVNAKDPVNVVIDGNLNIFWIQAEYDVSLVPYLQKVEEC